MSNVRKIRKRRGEPASERLARAAREREEDSLDRKDITELESSPVDHDRIHAEREPDTWEGQAITLCGTREAIRTLRGSEAVLKADVLEGWPSNDKLKVDVPDTDGTIVTVTNVKPEAGQELDIDGLLKELTDEQVALVMQQVFSWDLLEAQAKLGSIDRDLVRKHLHPVPKSPYIKTTRRRP